MSARVLQPCTANRSQPNRTAHAMILKGRLPRSDRRTPLSKLFQIADHLSASAWASQKWILYNHTRIGDKLSLKKFTRRNTNGRIGVHTPKGMVSTIGYGNSHLS